MKSYPQIEGYKRDIEKLAPNIVPYEQVKREVEDHIEELQREVFL